MNHGEFCWTEIATDNFDGCKDFYQKVFGWKLKKDDSKGEETNYHEFSTPGGDPMGGLYEMIPEMYGGKIPPSHFLNYIYVNDVDATTERAMDLDGEIILPPEDTDIPTVGRFAVISDPTGAIFALITTETNEDDPGDGEFKIPSPGTICWRALATQNVETAKSFYTGLVGWDIEQSQVSKMVCHEIHAGDTVIGGMLEINEKWGDGWENVPAHWTTYVAVGDCDAVAEKAKENNGVICQKPFDAERVGRMAIIKAPAGVSFSIIQFATSEQVRGKFNE